MSEVPSASPDSRGTAKPPAEGTRGAAPPAAKPLNAKIYDRPDRPWASPTVLAIAFLLLVLLVLLAFFLYRSLRH